jgi:hypothetical protein
MWDAARFGKVYVTLPSWHHESSLTSRQQFNNSIKLWLNGQWVMSRVRLLIRDRRLATASTNNNNEDPGKFETAG